MVGFTTLIVLLVPSGALCFSLIHSTMTPSSTRQALEARGYPEGGHQVVHSGETERTPIQEAKLSTFVYHSHPCELGRVALSLDLSFPTVDGGTSLALAARTVLGPATSDDPRTFAKTPHRDLEEAA